MQQMYNGAENFKMTPLTLPTEGVGQGELSNKNKNYDEYMVEREQFLNGEMGSKKLASLVNEN